jgi:hypothetical protein
MDTQVAFRIVLIVVAGLVLLAIVMHYNSCISRSEASGPREGFYYQVESSPTPYAAPAVIASQPSPVSSPASPMANEEGGMMSGGMMESELSLRPTNPFPACGNYSDELRPEDLLPKLTPDAE